MQSANKKKQSYLEMFNVPKSKPECVGKQETGKARLLQMAEEEHEEKMKVLALKKEVLELKKRKLEKELDGCKLCNHFKKQKSSTSASSASNSPKQVSPCFWQPF